MCCENACEQSPPEELLFQWGRESEGQIKEDFPLEGLALWQSQREEMLASCKFYSDKIEMCPNLIAGTCSQLHSKVKWKWDLCARWRTPIQVPAQRTWNKRVLGIRFWPHSCVLICFLLEYCYVIFISSQEASWIPIPWLLSSGSFLGV